MLGALGVVSTTNGLDLSMKIQNCIFKHKKVIEIVFRVRLVSASRSKERCNGSKMQNST